MMIKFRKPWQAILWEELSVSGSITLALLIVEVWMACLVHIAFPDWKFKVQDLDIVTYFLPGFNALLLMLIRGNQGELRGGFQRRLLFFPTHVISVVSIIIFSRLFLILLHTFILRSVCIYFFAIPYDVVYGDWRYVYSKQEMILDYMTFINLSADGSIYLLLQFLVWVFYWSKPVFTLIILGIIFLVVRVDVDLFLYKKANLLGFEMTYSLPTYIRSIVIDKPVEFLFFSTLLIWHLCMIVIKFYRHNLLTSFSIPLSFRGRYRKREGKYLKGFKSQFSALLWYEFKYGGFSLFKMTIFFWILIVIGKVFVSENDSLFELLSFDLMPLLKYYTLWGDDTRFVLVEAPFIALGFAVLYYWLRFSFGLGPTHPKYAGLIRFLPANNFERVNAYVFMLSINVLLVGLFIVFCRFLNCIYSSPSNRDLIACAIGKIVSDGGCTDYLAVGEFLLSLTASAMFIALVVLSLVSSKEVLPAMVFYLFIYGAVSSSVVYGFDYKTQFNYPLVRFCSKLLPWLSPVDSFLNPASGNYLYLYLVLIICFLYLVIKNRLLKNKEILFLILTFLIILVSLYPWNFGFNDWGKSLFQLKLYSSLAIVLVIPYFSCFLAFQGFRWRNGVKQVISSLGLGKNSNTGFFWGTKIPLLIMTGVILIFRIDLSYLTKYGLKEELNSTKLNLSNDALNEGIELKERIFALVEDCRKILNQSKEDKKFSVIFYPDYEDKNLYWYHFVWDGEKHNRIPFYVYCEMVDFYNDYGIKISSKIRKFLEESRSFSEESKKYFHNLDFPDKWSSISLLYDPLLLEVYVRGVSEDYDGMLDTLEVVREFGRLVFSNNSIYNPFISRIRGFILWYLHHAEVPIWVIDEFIKLVGDGFHFNYEEDYEYFKIDLLSYLNKFMVSPYDYWNKEMLNKNSRYTGVNYYYKRRDLFFKVLTSLSILSSGSHEVEEMYYPLLDLITISRVIDRTTLVLSYLVKDNEWKKFLKKGYIEKPEESDICKSSLPLPNVYSNLYFLTLVIEKYRIKYGKLPDVLEQLVPEFVDFLPCDPYNNGFDLGYKKLEPLGFVIYSYGHDFEDDGGFSEIYKQWGRLYYSYYRSKGGKITYDYQCTIPPLPFRQHGFTDGFQIISKESIPSVD